MTASSPAPPPANRLILFDTTLRDGEQSPGVSLNGAQKIQIGKALAELGVDVCEIGFPACAVDVEGVRQLVAAIGSYTVNRPSQQAMILAVLARCVKSDIDIAWDVIQHAQHPRIHVFYGTSDVHLEYKLKKTQQQALAAIHAMVSYACSKCSDVEFSAEDASRTSVEFLTQVVTTAIQCGARTINLPDTVGAALPTDYFNHISAVRSAVAQRVDISNVVFSVHCHNDLGLATANAVAGLQAGARQVECTINGIGERAGNTSLEEVVMAVQLHPKRFGTEELKHSVETRKLVPISQLVSELTGMNVQRNKAIVGENCCLHESGVHVDGILKNRSTYEIFAAETVGWTSHSGIVLGKHSGRAAYRSHAQALGVEFDNEATFEAAFRRFQQLVKDSPQQTFSNEQILATTREQSGENNAVKSSNSVSRQVGRVVNGVNTYKIIELLGDGISEEITAEARKVLEAIERASAGKMKFEVEQHPIGGRAIDANGSPLPDSSLSACRASDAVLLGAVGDPKYSSPHLKVRPEQGLLKIRSELELYQNLRPVKVYEQLIDASPFQKHVVSGTDIMIVRELTGGIYNNVHEQNEKDARDVMYYTVEEIERIIRAAAELARGRKKKLTSLDKANVLACSRLWRQVCTRIMKDEFPDVEVEHLLIDAASMHIVKRPTDYDVIVTENLFGDILSDEAAALTSSLGMLGSASIGHPNTPGLFEPIHGSAPDIAGKGIANPVGTILATAMMLRYGLKQSRAADAVEAAVEWALQQGIVTGDVARQGQQASSTSQVGQAIAERVQQLLTGDWIAPIQQLSLQRRRPMTLPEKILCHQAVGLTKAEVAPGDVIVVKVHRTLASEMTWVGMSETYEHIGKPGLWRKDRFWLAIDHTVDPSNYEQPKQKLLIGAAEKFAKEVNLDDYMGPNQSILHTEFYRQRAVPGTIIIGADSHSCSAGCLASYATGMGAADVVMPVVTGQTFMQVPQTLLINFKNDLPFGMTGKDVMLYILQKLKRNTVALERAVEFSGSIKSLSVDSRFALANMATEFGAIAGIFPSDEVTAAFMAERRLKKKLAGQHDNDKDEDENDSNYRNFRADPDAQYADRYDIDLTHIAPLIAKYPSPDNVYSIDDPEIDVPVPEVGRSIRHLDGVFIGACTTTEEEIILAALVLEVLMQEGKQVTKAGTRKVTPGSAIMLQHLEELGICDIYRRAGFTIGAPGCSYCLGVGADVAPKGSVWLSSQNRNFRNRMGPGSIGNLASAATVAASSFDLIIADPRPALAKVNRQRFEQLLNRQQLPASVPIHEPEPELVTEDNSISSLPESESAVSSQKFELITGQVQRFGDHVDTDAIIPGQLMLDRPLSKLGKHSFKLVRPEFVERVAQGRKIVVAGEGFGCGSSREEAVSCLRACGVKAVIAKGFSFIYGRNLLCLNLIGIIIQDEKFYELAQEGATVTIDIEQSFVECAGQRFAFTLSDIQRQIYRNGGVIEMYRQSGRQVFQRLAAYARQRRAVKTGGCQGGCGSGAEDRAFEDVDEEQRRPVKATGKVEW